MRRSLVQLLALLLAACGSPAVPGSPAASAGAHPRIEPGEVARWRPEVVARIAHDPAAFTEGLVIVGDRLYESTGLRGESTLRELDRVTGEVLRTEPLEPDLFGEGLAVVDDRLLQLTWQEETLLVWDRASLEVVERVSYAGEGWGLCLLGERLVMSDGSATLTIRDATTFAELARVAVTRAGEPQAGLNELECVGGLVFANARPTNEIVVIGADDGRVVATIDASALVDEVGAPGDLNGIAYDPATESFLLTGKRWPTTFEVRFVEAP